MKFIKIAEDFWVNIAILETISLKKEEGESCVDEDKPEIVWVVKLGLECTNERFEFETEGAARDKLNSILNQIRK